MLVIHAKIKNPFPDRNVKYLSFTSAAGGPLIIL